MKLVTISVVLLVEEDFDETRLEQLEYAEFRDSASGKMDGVAWSDKLEPGGAQIAKSIVEQVL